jgi:hypothetical protein
MRLQFRPSKTQIIGRNYEKNLLSNPVAPPCLLFTVFVTINTGKSKKVNGNLDFFSSSEFKLE